MRRPVFTWTGLVRTLYFHAMKSTAETDRLYTLDEYRDLPSDDLWQDELVRGRLVRQPRPAVPHGRLQSLIAQRLWNHLQEAGSDGLVLTESGFVLSEDPATVRGPDIAYISPERLPEETLEMWAHFAPDLAVEVLSPSDGAAAVQEKVLDYLDAGSRMVWVVDPASRSATVYRSLTEIRVLSDEDTLDGGDVLPGLRIPLKELFGG